MIEANRSLGEAPSVYRKRVYARGQIPFKPNSFNIDLGQAKTGRILNISEGGLAVQTNANPIGGLIPQIRFRFSNSQVWIETVGKVIWTDESRGHAGIEFIGLSVEGRDQIRDWLAMIRTPGSVFISEQESQTFASTQFVDPPATHAEEKRELQESQIFPEPVAQSTSGSAVWKSNDVEHDRRPRWLVGLVVVILVACLAFLSIRYVDQKATPPQEQTQGKPLAEPIQVSVDRPEISDPPTPAIAEFKPVYPPKQLPGFVLQAGAMAREVGANALADTLRQQNFPVFVDRSGSDHLYRVYVGPYPDHHSAVDIRTELGLQGLRAILKRWTPPGKQ